MMEITVSLNGWIGYVIVVMLAMDIMVTALSCAVHIARLRTQPEVKSHD